MGASFHRYQWVRDVGVVDVLEFFLDPMTLLLITVGTP